MAKKRKKEKDVGIVFDNNDKLETSIIRKKIKQRRIKDEQEQKQIKRLNSSILERLQNLEDEVYTLKNPK